VVAAAAGFYFGRTTAPKIQGGSPGGIQQPGVQPPGVQQPGPPGEQLQGSPFPTRGQQPPKPGESQADYESRIRHGTPTQTLPIPAAQSLHHAAAVIAASKQAAQTATPMPEAIRAILAKRKPQQPQPEPETEHASEWGRENTAADPSGAPASSGNADSSDGSRWDDGADA